MYSRLPWRAIGLFALACAACLCLAGPVLAQQPRVTAQGIPYLSGGIGTDERAAMDAVAGQYTLKLEFARADRAFLGDIPVAFRGPVNLDLLSEGPILLIRLPAGRYAVTATSGDVAKTQTVDVGQTGLRAAAFIW